MFGKELNPSYHMFNILMCVYRVIKSIIDKRRLSG